ncbi:MAG: ABC transporter substrate-binding protein [Chloroflexi bacterium]|nr:ABC transporter substrate-binding protein [Chloroflexota bacterium]
MNPRVFMVFPLVLALLAAACGGAQTTATPTSTTAATTVKVRIALDWFPWSNHSGLFIAKEKGYFAAEGLDVTIYTPDDPSTVLATVGAGQDDFGLSYQNEVLFAAAQGVPVVSVAALVQHPLNSVMALESSGIERPSHLKGKKIGVPGVPTDEAFLDTMLKQEGLSLSDVTLVNVGFDLVPALISGQVDAIAGAYWVHESISAQNQGFPVNVLRFEDWGIPDFYEIVVVTSRAKTEQQSDLVQRFVRAVMKGYQEAVADPQKAIDLLKQAAPEIDEAIERPGVELLAPLWIEGNSPFGWQTEGKWVAFAEWMLEHGLVDRAVDGKAAFTNRFIEEAM